MITLRNNYILPFALAVVASMTFASCQSRLKVKIVDKPLNSGPAGDPAVTNSPDIEAKAPPVEVPGAASAPRQYYQSRSSIGLRISLMGFAQNSSVDVTNSTTGKTLLSGLNPDLDSKTPEYRFYNVGMHGDLTLYPTFGNTEAETRNAKFAYGLNKIVFLAEEAAASRQSSIDIFLIDSPFFAQASMFFDSGEQREGGLEGLFESIPSAVLSNGKNLMILGNIPVVTR